MTDAVVKGKSVKCTKLVPGSAYVMATWGKQKVFESVQFIGIGVTADDAQNKAPTGNLKTLAVDTKFFVVRNGETVEIDVNDERNVLLLNGLRVTFTLPGETDEQRTARIVAEMAAEHGVTLESVAG